MESYGTFVNWKRWAGARASSTGQGSASAAPGASRWAALSTPHQGRATALSAGAPRLPLLRVARCPPHGSSVPGTACTPRCTLQAPFPVSLTQAAWASLSTGLRPSALLAEASEGKSGTPRGSPAVITGQAPGGGAPVLLPWCRQGAAQAMGPAATCSSAAWRLWYLVLRVNSATLDQ